MTPDLIDPAICPLCGSGNHCSVARGDAAEKCWCMQADVSAMALAKIPANSRNRACICPRCATGTTIVAGLQEFVPDE